MAERPSIDAAIFTKTKMVYMKIAALAVFLLIAIAGAHGEQNAFLQSAGAIELPGVEGRIDHMAVDQAGKRLFVAALGNNTVEVIDLAAKKVVSQLKGMEEPQGIAVAPDLNRLAVASGGDGAVRIYDLKSLRLLHTIRQMPDADNVRYDAQAHHFWVGYGSGTLAAIDADTGKQITNINLDGH